MPGRFVQLNPTPMRFATLLLACALPFCAQADVRVVGSDLIKPVIEPVLQNFQTKTGEVVQLSMSGSMPGSEKWQDGNAEILVEAVLPGRPVPHGAIPLAYSAIIVQVSPANPVQELTLPQLAAIYGQNIGQSIQRWGELGASGTFANQSINPAVVENRQRILIDQFRSSVLKNQQFRQSVKRLASQSEVQAALSGDPGTIVITDRLPASGAAKALSLSLGGQGDFAFGPTEQNIHYGEYPLRMGYYLRLHPQASAATREVAMTLLGAQVSQRLVEAGFIPTPETLRKRFLLELDK